METAKNKMGIPLSAILLTLVGRGACLSVNLGLPSKSTSELKSLLLESSAKFRAAQEVQWSKEEAMKTAVLNAESVANVESTVSQEADAIRQNTIDLILALAERNPTAEPFANWRTKMPEPLDGDWTRTRQARPLDGEWTLEFTTAADATFRKTEKNPGTATTYQTIDSTTGLFVNCVDFDSEESKLQGFRVFVRGEKLSDSEVRLKFRRVKLLRRGRIKAIIIPLPPSWFLRGVARFASRGKAKLSERGAGFEMLYLDSELRCHKTFDGQYFVQKRRTP